MVSLQKKIILLSFSHYENMYKKNYTLLLKWTLLVQTKACIAIHKIVQLENKILQEIFF